MFDDSSYGAVCRDIAILMHDDHACPDIAIQTPPDDDDDHDDHDHARRNTIPRILMHNDQVQRSDANISRARQLVPVPRVATNVGSTYRPPWEVANYPLRPRVPRPTLSLDVRVIAACAAVASVSAAAVGGPVAALAAATSVFIATDAVTGASVGVSLAAFDTASHIVDVNRGSSLGFGGDAFVTAAATAAAVGGGVAAVVAAITDAAAEGVATLTAAAGFPTGTARNRPNETPVRSNHSQIVSLSDEMISILLKTPLPNKDFPELGRAMQLTPQEIEVFRQKNSQDNISGSVEMIKEWRRSLKRKDNDEVAALCELMAKANMKPQADEFYEKCDRSINAATLEILKGMIIQQDGRDSKNAAPLEFFELPFSGKEASSILAKPPDFRASDEEKKMGTRPQPPGRNWSGMSMGMIIDDPPITDENIVIKTLDEHGGRLYLEKYDVTLQIPSGRCIRKRQFASNRSKSSYKDAFSAKVRGE